jgi:hypothetical protein
MVQMIQAMVLMTDNMSFPTASAVRCIQCEDNKSLEMFVQHCQRIVWSHEESIHQFIHSNTICLKEFIKRHWSDAGNIKFNTFHYQNDEKSLYWVTCTTSSGDRVVHVDPIFGRFLIDGAPVKRLPEQISESPLYQRVFGNAVFEVQPSAERAGSYTTTTALNGSRFSFSCFFDFDEKTVCITQTHDGCDFLLLDKSRFDGRVPWEFSDAFSHWIDLNSSTIHFRPVSFMESRFNALPRYKAFCQGEKATCFIQDTSSKRILVNAKLPIVKDISQLFSRLEREECVHVLVPDKASGPTGCLPVVNLPRLGLTFAIKNDCIECVQYTGMFVENQQHFGALCGLKDYLLISNGSTRQVLVTRALYARNQEEHNWSNVVRHCIVRVSLPEASDEHIDHYAYELDERLKMIRATAPVSEISLAYLHALCAYPLPEPFTAETGIEACFEALKKHDCNFPLDDTSRDLLEEIKKCATPRRSQYPRKGKPRFSQTFWPQHATPNIVSDAISLYIDSMISKRHELASLHGSALPKEKERDAVVEALVLRSYFQHLHHFPPQFSLQELPEAKLNSLKIDVNLSNGASDVWKTAFYFGRHQLTVHSSTAPDESFFLAPGELSGPVAVSLSESLLSWTKKLEKLATPPQAALTIAALALQVRSGEKPFAQLLWLCGYLAWRFQQSQTPPPWFFPLFLGIARSVFNFQAVPEHRTYDNPSVCWDQSSIQEIARNTQCGYYVKNDQGRGSGWIHQAREVAQWVTTEFFPERAPTLAEWPNMKNNQQFKFNLDAFNVRMQHKYASWRTNYLLRQWLNSQLPLFRTVLSLLQKRLNFAPMPSLQLCGQLSNSALPRKPFAASWTSSPLLVEAETLFTTNQIERFEELIRGCISHPATDSSTNVVNVDVGAIDAELNEI